MPRKISAGLPIAPKAAPVTRLTLLICSLGIVVVFLDLSIVNVALERISAGLQAGVTDLQWIVDAYTLTFAGFLMTAGALGDRCGNKGVFWTGILVFTLSSAVCGLAPNLGLLIGGRVLQGVGAALILPSSLTLVNHAFEDPGKRAKAIGIWAGSGGIAVAAGPLLGGLLVNAFGWRSIFFVNLPIGAVALALAGRFIHREEHLAGRRIDLLGQITSLIALTALVGTLIEGPRLGWTSAPLAGLGIVFILFSVLWYFVEANQSDPMLPLELFRLPGFSAVSLVGFLVNIPFYGAIFTFSLYFQNVRHFTPLQTGMAFLPMTALLSVGNIWSGRLAAQRGARFPVLIGLGIGALGFFCVAATAAENANFVLLLVEMIAIGVGFSLIVPPLTAVLLASVHRSQVGVASGAFNTSRQIGTAAGVALLGSLLSSQASLLAGFRLGMFLSGFISLMAAAVTYFYIHPSKDLVVSPLIVE